ncbi:MAG: hypothetical protein ND895_23445 [Pyrinomonadaceae bacterium]|nr:hypothetical protein [Pyrinomonadaceae bacterium]
MSVRGIFRTVAELVLLCVVAGMRGQAVAPQTEVPDQRPEIIENDPLIYATFFARRTDNQNALGKIAVFYAELGRFEQAMRIVESVSEDDWQTSALGEIAVEYWKHGFKDKSRQLFLRIAGLPLPKDVIYIWGDIIENMAAAQQFDLALDVAASMAPSDASTISSALVKTIDEFEQARRRDRKLPGVYVPDILPRVLAIAKALPDGEDSAVLKRVAVYYAARGEFPRAEKLIQRFKEDYDREDGASDIAVQLAKLGQYDRAVQLAGKAGDYFGPITLVQIAGEAIKRKDKPKALEIAARTDALLTKKMKEADEDLSWLEAQRLSELAVVYSQLGRSTRAAELVDVAFKKARTVGKPGDRFTSFRAVVAAYTEVGLYSKAVEAARALYGDQINMDMVAEIAAHAVDKGQGADLAQTLDVIRKSPLMEHPEMRVKALATVADKMATLGHLAEALKILQGTKEFADGLAENDNEATPQILKDYAVAWARAGDFHTALHWVAKNRTLYFANWGLIELGQIAAKSGLTLDDESLRLMEEIAKSDLPPPVEPRRILNEAGWEIPGLAVSRKLRPPELRNTRNRTYELYITLYEPEVEAFLKRPFPSREKPKPEESNWKSQGLKIRLIEERVVNGRKYCYAITSDEIFQDETNQPRYSNGPEMLFYYDEDGDGKFETLEEGLDYFWLGHIPAWVLQK